MPFTEHDEYLVGVKRKEDLYTWVSLGIMVSSAILPFLELDAATVGINKPLITVGATLLGLSNLAFSRRYLHGEFMFGRMTLCSAFMVSGFNLMNSAPTLEAALLGWTIIGYSSTFLIGGL